MKDSRLKGDDPTSHMRARAGLALSLPNGFTLMELLLSVAIISLLASVVLASISGARESAREASILSSLDNANTQATLYYNQNGDYAGLCNNSGIEDIVSNLESTADGVACFTPEGGEQFISSSQAKNLLPRDYGIGVKLGDTYYAGSPAGSGTFFADDAPGGEMNWYPAKQACSDAGGRLSSGPSVLRAIYDIEESTPEGFMGRWYWSGLESPSDSSKAYRVYLGGGYYGGYVKTISKSNYNYVRCLR